MKWCTESWEDRRVLRAGVPKYFEPIRITIGVHRFIKTCDLKWFACTYILLLICEFDVWTNLFKHVLLICSWKCPPAVWWPRAGALEYLPAMLCWWCIVGNIQSDSSRGTKLIHRLQIVLGNSITRSSKNSGYSGLYWLDNFGCWKMGEIVLGFIKLTYYYYSANIIQFEICVPSRYQCFKSFLDIPYLTIFIIFQWISINIRG